MGSAAPSDPYLLILTMSQGPPGPPGSTGPAGARGPAVSHI